MYIIDITHLYSTYCVEKTKDFKGVDTRYFQIGEQLRLTVILYDNDVPYFLLANKDYSPVDRLEYLYLTEKLGWLYPNIKLPKMAEQWYNEETGVLHVRPLIRSDLNWEA